MKNKFKKLIYPQFSHKRGSSSNNRFFSRNRIIGITAILILLVVTTGIYPPTKKVDAAGLDSVVTTLSSEVADAESQISTVFTPSNPLIDNDRITVYVGEDSGGDPWTDDDVTIDSTDVVCTQGGTAFDGEFYNAAGANGPVNFGCDVAGAGDGNPITVELGDGLGDDMYNPAGADNYSVAVVTTDDSGAGIAYVGDANDVDVSVTVLPNLALLIDSADGTNCTTTAGVTSCDLGTVLTTTIAEGNYDVNVGTNAAGGATISIAEDGDLGTIADCTEDDTITEGTEDYGADITDNGMNAYLNDWADNDTPIEASETVANTGNENDITTGDDFNFSHEVAVDSTTAAGTHSHTVTWTATGDF